MVMIDQLKFPTLRRAQEDDAPLLVSILHAAFAEYEGQLDPPSGVHNETIDTVLQKLQEGHAVLAFLDAEAVGCVFYEPESDYVYLGRLSVLPQHRKQGVARALIDYVEQQAVILQRPRVLLGVRTAIPRLQAYYARLGYHLLRYAMHEGYSEPTYAILEKEID